ncbi:MAG: hypothetical protein U1C52_01400, partial [Patescibacteria group bacterium]|nr:hypothetical protein [Patescibacteria group bacterium]
GIQNQNEEGIDCGGECEACGLRGLEVGVGTVEALAVVNRTTLAVPVQNPSANFGLNQVEYSFKVLDRVGQSLASTEGSFSLMPLEKKYIVESGLDFDRSDLGEVIFELGKTDFVPFGELPQYDVQIGNVTTTFPGEEVWVSGSLINEESFGIREMRLAAVLYTERGALVNAGNTLVNSIPAFGRKDFIIRLPRSGVSVDPGRTMVYTTIIVR